MSLDIVYNSFVSYELFLIWFDDTNGKEKNNNSKLKEGKRNSSVNLLDHPPHPPTIPLVVGGGLVGWGVVFGELTPEEYDIKAFRVSSNGDV